MCIRDVRRFDCEQPFRLRDLIGAVRRAPLHLAYMGLMLMLFALLWIRIATLMFALFFGSSMPPLLDIFGSLFLTVHCLSRIHISQPTGPY